MGRIENDSLILDMRTVAENEEDVLFASLGSALRKSPRGEGQND
jgi:hypothetical protein